MQEIWKKVKKNRAYEISNLGRVRSLQTGKISLGHATSRGYRRIQFSTLEGSVSASVHRLVAEAFLPNKTHRPQVNHLNGVKHDNRASNLEWCTASENVEHAHATGLTRPPRGSAHYKALLTEDQVALIKSRKNYAHVDVIAVEYGVSIHTIKAIWQGKSWRHVEPLS